MFAFNPVIGVLARSFNLFSKIFSHPVDSPQKRALPTPRVSDATAKPLAQRRMECRVPPRHSGLPPTQAAGMEPGTPSRASSGNVEHQLDEASLNIDPGTASQSYKQTVDRSASPVSLSRIASIAPSDTLGPHDKDVACRYSKTEHSANGPARRG